MNYYNEFDPNAAAWLRELINENLISFGYVDERSITEVTVEDVEGFTQCHFFAGIGGWSYALRLAGIPDDMPLWTGSPPCQPFSVAGSQLGHLDPRHLAPTFMRLVDECRPPILIGEQVAAAISKHWLDDLFIELEKQNYACASAVLPACGIGSPHKRERLFFGAMAHTYNTRPQGRLSRGSDSKREIISGHSGCGGSTSGMADAVSQLEYRGRTSGAKGRNEYSDGGNNGFWRDADWLYCKDNKYRPVEPSTFPLADGIPRRLGHLRDESQSYHPQEARAMRIKGYGNAVVPQVASEFIKAFISTIER